MAQPQAEFGRPQDQDWNQHYGRQSKCPDSNFRRSPRWRGRILLRERRFAGSLAGFAALIASARSQLVKTRLRQ